MAKSFTTTSAPLAPEPTTQAEVNKLRKKHAEDLVKKLLSRMERDPNLENSLAPLIIHQGEMTKLTVAELAAVVDTNPNHPVAAVFAGVLRKHPVEATVHVERIHIEAIVDDKDVITDEVLENQPDGTTAKVQRKKLVARGQTTRA